MSHDAMVILSEVYDLSLASIGSQRPRIIVLYSPSGPNFLGHGLS